MRKQKLPSVTVFFVIFSMSILLILCEKSDNTINSSIPVNKDTSVGEMSELENMADEMSVQASELAQVLTSLQNGETKSLVGYSFGDEFDYNAFNISYSDGESYMYQPIDSQDRGLHCLFDGRGHGFSGLAAYGEEDFLGIHDLLESYSMMIREEWNITNTM